MFGLCRGIILIDWEGGGMGRVGEALQFKLYSPVHFILCTHTQHPSNLIRFKLCNTILVFANCGPTLKLVLIQSQRFLNPSVDTTFSPRSWKQQRNEQPGVDHEQLLHGKVCISHSNVLRCARCPLQRWNPNPCWRRDRRRGRVAVRVEHRGGEGD